MKIPKYEIRFRRRVSAMKPSWKAMVLAACVTLVISAQAQSGGGFD